eukprot:759064-Hanusia_phi.AAC.4
MLAPQPLATHSPPRATSTVLPAPAATSQPRVSPLLPHLLGDRLRVESYSPLHICSHVGQLQPLPQEADLSSVLPARRLRAREDCSCMRGGEISLRSFLHPIDQQCLASSESCRAPEDSILSFLIDGLVDIPRFIHLPSSGSIPVPSLLFQ